MPRFRFSLLALLGFVTAAAVCCAALVKPTEFWEAVIEVAALGALFFAAITALYGQGAAKAFGAGFTVVGWGYYWMQQFERFGLTTQRISLELQDLIHPAQPGLGGGGGGVFNIPPGGAVQGEFLEIARWLWPVLLGLIGGLAARHLYLRRERPMPQK